MAFQELVKNYEKVRAYLREFYVYGFKSRTEFEGKSPRSYDDERRRLECWLGDYMRFTQTSEGKCVFLSVDSRETIRNPLYKAWKAKSFTDGDITLHLAIFDILYRPEIQKTLSELVEEIDQLLSSRMTFDESTLRKKLKEYTEEGLINVAKKGRRVIYSRSQTTELSGLGDVISFFSETAPCGVIGSFLQDRLPEQETLFSFKHHYITGAMDSDVLATLFDAIRGHRYITVDNLGKHADRVRTVRLVPLRIYISAQNGRQYLIAFHEATNHLNSYRLDYLSKVRIEEPCEKFDALQHKPTMPLTTLEKRWLKSIQDDPKLRLFDVRYPELQDVEPLFTRDDYRIFDQYTDGDPFEDETYIAHFRLLQTGIQTHRPVRITMTNRHGKRLKFRFYPVRFEYSMKDDKIRVIAAGCQFRQFNLGRIESCTFDSGQNLEILGIPEATQKELTHMVMDRRNALERVMLHFAHFEKQAQRLEGDRYILRMKYYESDETEVVIRVLSFGPCVQVLGPQSFVELIRQRLIAQKSCELR